jgi:hypothetical protein
MFQNTLNLNDVFAPSAVLALLLSSCFMGIDPDLVSVRFGVGGSN